jgi:hypothetical protein
MNFVQLACTAHGQAARVCSNDVQIESESETGQLETRHPLFKLVHSFEEIFQNI